MIVFLTLAGLGLALLLISAMFGHHEFGDHEVELAGDHETELHHELSHEHDENAGEPGPFSLRVISIFLCSFGGFGAIARYYGLSYPLSTLVGGFGGWVVAYLGLLLIRLMWRQQASSNISTSDLVGYLGEVRTTIPFSGLGEVAVVYNEQSGRYAAKSDSGQEITIGTTVKVLSSVSGVLVVSTQIN